MLIINALKYLSLLLFISFGVGMGYMLFSDGRTTVIIDKGVQLPINNKTGTNILGDVASNNKVKVGEIYSASTVYTIYPSAYLVVESTSGEFRNMYDPNSRSEPFMHVFSYEHIIIDVRGEVYANQTETSEEINKEIDEALKDYYKKNDINE